MPFRYPQAEVEHLLVLCHTVCVHHEYDLSFVTLHYSEDVFTVFSCIKVILVGNFHKYNKYCIKSSTKKKCYIVTNSFKTSVGGIIHTMSDRSIGKVDLPYKRDYLILYTRFIFLVTAKTCREDFLFIPDSFGNHWNIPEHDDE